MSGYKLVAKEDFVSVPLTTTQQERYNDWEIATMNKLASEGITFPRHGMKTAGQMLDDLEKKKEAQQKMVDIIKKRDVYTRDNNYLYNQIKRIAHLNPNDTVAWNDLSEAVRVMTGSMQEQRDLRASNGLFEDLNMLKDYKMDIRDLTKKAERQIIAVAKVRDHIYKTVNDLLWRAFDKAYNDKTADCIIKLREGLRSVSWQMKGNQAMMIATWTRTIDDLPSIRSMVDLTESVTSITIIRSKINSISKDAVRDQTYRFALEQRLDQTNPDLLRMSVIVDALPEDATWEDVLLAVKRFCDKTTPVRLNSNTSITQIKTPGRESDVLQAYKTGLQDASGRETSDSRGRSSYGQGGDRNKSRENSIERNAYQRGRSIPRERDDRERSRDRNNAYSEQTRKECWEYKDTGKCKFGVECKFRPWTADHGHGPATRERSRDRSPSAGRTPGKGPRGPA